MGKGNDIKGKEKVIEGSASENRAEGTARAHRGDGYGKGTETISHQTQEQIKMDEAMALKLQEEEKIKPDKEADSHNILDWLTPIAGYENDPYADIGRLSNSTHQLQLGDEGDPELQAALMMSMHDNNTRTPSHIIDIAAGEGTSDSTLAHIDKDELQAALRMSLQHAQSNE